MAVRVYARGRRLVAEFTGEDAERVEALKKKLGLKSDEELADYLMSRWLEDLKRSDGE